MASGLLVLFPPFASLKFGDVVVTLNTFAGMTSLIVGVVIVACGVSFWTRPQFKFVAGIVTLLLAVSAIVTANLGTFLIGTLLGVLGAALGIAWSPKPKPKEKRRSRRRSEDAEETTVLPRVDGQQEAAPAGAAPDESSQYADAGGRV
jgi:peptidoglycan/LPS O-acetylase OafA/YrhL